MKNTILTKITATLTIVFALAFTASAQTSNRYGGSYAKGVQLFYAEDYAGAANEFKKAEAENPGNHAAYLWHGLAYVALGDLDVKAANIWLKMPYDEKWKSTSRYFMGLGYWQTGYTKSAKYWFEETIKHPETPAAKLAQTALKSLLNDGEAPSIKAWATLANLPGAKTIKDFEGREEAESTVTSSAEQTEAQPARNFGAKPSGGLWKATISNGYKGQTLSFRVSPDGKTISDITFKGYLQCRGSRIEDTQLAPLENVAITGGAFDSVQLNGGAMVRFEFKGTFNSATTASVTYRVMSSTDCDTYELKWTASRAGN